MARKPRQKAPLTNGEEVVEATTGAAPLPGTQALRKGLNVLNIIADAPKALRFNALVARSQMPNGTLSRLLQTLIDYRLVHLENLSQTYRLGPRTFEMAHKTWRDFDLRAAAGPELDRLFETSQENVRLGLLEDQKVLVVDGREAVHALRITNGLGQRLDPHASALGKALLAYLNDEEFETFVTAAGFERFTDSTITDAEALRRDLTLTKARGYAVSFEERHIGVNAIAATVLDHRLAPVGAIGVSAPSCRWSEEQMHRMAGDVMRAARRIAGNLGETAMSVSSDPRPLSRSRDGITLVDNPKPLLGEGPVWDDRSGAVVWVDLLGPAMHRTTVATGRTQTTALPQITSVIAPRRSGGYVAAMKDAVVTMDADGVIAKTIAVPEPDLPGNRLNDAKCDAKGRFWVGSLAIDTSPGKGSLYCVEAGGHVRRAATGFQISNGLGWSPDNTVMYFTDSGRRVIYAYDFDLDSGELVNQRVFAQAPDGEGRPDGLAVDVEGGVWSAHWDGWLLVRYAPDGRVDRTIDVPVPKPTACAFGGPGLNTLYVTSARVRLSALQIEEAPLSGGLFALDVGVAGLPVANFAG